MPIERKPTALNGGIAPTVRQITLTVVEYTIGRGIEGDPVRRACAFYAPDNAHLFTVDGDRVVSPPIDFAAIIAAMQPNI